jgi:hypothetical protein
MKNDPTIHEEKELKESIRQILKAVIDLKPPFHCYGPLISWISINLRDSI